MEGKGKLVVARMELPKELYDHFIITSIKGNAPYFMIGFKNDEAFGKAMADAAKRLKETRQK